MNTRRKLLIALGSGALAAPFASFAQRPTAKIWRIGFLAARPRFVSMDVDPFSTFPQGLRELGYVEGKNIAIEWRFADGKYERLPGLAVELVRLKVDVIVAVGSAAVIAAQKATTSIPIVIGGVGDPVALGLVASLSRPGGNTTGRANLVVDVSSKSLEFLLAIVPKLSRVAVLLNPTNPSDTLALKQIQATARLTGVRVSVFKATSASEIDTGFRAIARARVGALILAPDPYYLTQARQIAELAAKNHLPAIFSFRQHVEAGGLMSYGPEVSFRYAAAYVDKIFKGAKPADMPIQQDTRIYLVINRKTAKALGLKVPQELLLRADEVIE